jgi:hypothetical protein
VLYATMLGPSRTDTRSLLPRRSGPADTVARTGSEGLKLMTSKSPLDLPDAAKESSAGCLWPAGKTGPLADLGSVEQRLAEGEEELGRPEGHRPDELAVLG